MANGGQYVTRTGPTVTPASYADSLDWGEDMFVTTIVTTSENSNEFPVHKTTKTSSEF